MKQTAKKATIVHVSAFPYPGAGGVERRLVDHLSYVVMNSTRPVRQDPSEVLTALPVQTYILRRKYILDIRLVFQLANVLRGVSADAVHTGAFTGFLWGGLATLLNKRVNLVRREHGSIVIRSNLNKIVDWLLTRRCDALVANSNAIKMELVRKLRFPADSIHVVHNGINVEMFLEGWSANSVRESLEIGADSPVVGTVGIFHPWKDQQTLVRSVPKVLESFPNATFVMEIYWLLVACLMFAKRGTILALLRHQVQIEDSDSNTTPDSTQAENSGLTA